MLDGPTVHADRNVAVAEYCALMAAVGWGSGYEATAVRRSLAAYPFIAHARAADGCLVGYVSAFSDEAFSTMLGELVVHPDFRGRGVGRRLLTAVEQRFPAVPVYAKPLGAAAAQFFRACGYRAPAVEMPVLFKRNG